MQIITDQIICFGFSRFYENVRDSAPLTKLNNYFNDSIGSNTFFWLFIVTPKVGDSAPLRFMLIKKKRSGVFEKRQIPVIHPLRVVCTVPLKCTCKLPDSSRFSRDESRVSRLARFTEAAILEYITELTFLVRRKI